MKIKKARNNDADIDTDFIKISNCFAHLIKEISITCYGNDKQIMPTLSTYEIYHYSDAMLKHLPERSLKKLQKIMLYSNKPVVYNKATIDRGTYNSIILSDITAGNLGDRITLFRD